MALIKRTVHPGCFPLVPTKTKSALKSMVNMIDCTRKSKECELSASCSIEILTNMNPRHQPNSEAKCQVAQIIRRCLSFRFALAIDGTSFPFFLLGLKIRYSPRMECTIPSKKLRIPAIKK